MSRSRIYVKNNSRTSLTFNVTSDPFEYASGVNKDTRFGWTEGPVLMCTIGDPGRGMFGIPTYSGGSISFTYTGRNVHNQPATLTCALLIGKAMRKNITGAWKDGWRPAEFDLLFENTQISTSKDDRTALTITVVNK